MPKRKTHEEFVNQLKERKGNDYILLSEYLNERTDLKVKHTVCGTVFYPKPGNLLRKSGCPMCARKSFGKHKTHTKDEFKSMFYEVFPNDFSLTSDYESSVEKVEVKHIPCGNIYKVLPGNLIHKRSGCPFCVSTSKGEMLVEEFLKVNNVKFESQYSFDDCVYKSKLKFDFAIFDNLEHLIGLIEFDGEQHFKSKEFFGGDKEFEKVQIRDQIKNDYCQSHNIFLLRIPHWEKDRVNEIIDDFLLKTLRNAC
jgi:hypothetical protein